MIGIDAIGPSRPVVVRPKLPRRHRVRSHSKANFPSSATRVSPRMVYVDGSKPDWIEGFTKNTFTVMIEGIRNNAVATGLMTNQEFQQGVQDLLRTATSEGVFSYTFFKAVAAV